MRVVAIGDTIKVWVNGEFLNEGFGATVSEGRIAFQAECAEVEVRRLILDPI